jgi:chemotaxis protein methyltransferase CheR
MGVLNELERDLTDQEYELFRKLVYEKSGINLGGQKQQLVRARLGKRLRAGRFKSYRQYYEFVKNDPTQAELSALIDAISTNTTHLFREQQHFDFLARTLRALLEDRKWRAANNPLRIWSAGCSSGDEPYSIAMTLDDLTSGRDCDWKILATDISTQVLERAKSGLYEGHRLGTVPAPFRQRYFARAPGHERGPVQVRQELRARIRFSYFNLMTPVFPFKHGFHFIFCRNVMIYFDRPTQEQLVARFAGQLRPGGYLLIGHSESLNAIQHPLRYVQPTIYQRAAP